MLNVAADPVPSIREADATGDIAVLYDDIRATLGVPVVNLIWRHLAVLPGGLMVRSPQKQMLCAMVFRCQLFQV